MPLPYTTGMPQGHEPLLPFVQCLLQQLEGIYQDHDLIKGLPASKALTVRGAGPRG